MKTDLQIEQWPIDRLVPYEKNSRTHSTRQIEQIMSSIRTFGFVNPILVGSDGVITAGEGRWRAARGLGLTTVPVIVLGYLSAAKRQALVVADNQIAMNSGWNEEMLRSELDLIQKNGFDLNLTLGFSDEEMAALQDDEEVTVEGKAPEDEAPAVAEASATKRGDVWLLGEHRLVCGSAEVLSDLQKALGGTRADMVFTDPPYNVDYEGKTAEKLKIDNDALGGRFYEFLRDSCANMMAVTDGAIYVCMSSSELHTLYKAFTDAGGHWSTFLIWAKHHFTLGRSDYQRMYEPILYGWREGSDHHWCGERNVGDVIEVKRPSVNKVHPTMKPIELVEKILRYSSKPHSLILDPFAGSGTTVIACCKTARRAAVIEMDTHYCDVIVRRWQDFTGKEAVLESDRRPFAAVLQEAA